MKLICLVLFVMTMFLWLLALLSTFIPVSVGGWLPWFACLFLAGLCVAPGNLSVPK